MTVPNLLSLLRMGLTPLFIIAVINGQVSKALLIFAIAGITDGLDGFIARFFDQQSLLGTYLDPIADKLLLTTAYVMLSLPGQVPGVGIPVWVTVLVIARDVLIVVVALVLYLASGVRRFPPTMLSKLTTTVQVATVLLVLLSGLLHGFDLAAEVATYTVGGLTVASGLDYIFRSTNLVEGGRDAETP